MAGFFPYPGRPSIRALGRNPNAAAMLAKGTTPAMHLRALPMADVIAVHPGGYDARRDRKSRNRQSTSTPSGTPSAPASLARFSIPAFSSPRSTWPM